MIVDGAPFQRAMDLKALDKSVKPMYFSENILQVRCLMTTYL